MANLVGDVDFNMLTRYMLEGGTVVAVSSFMTGTPIFTTQNIQLGLTAAGAMFLIDSFLPDYTQGFRLGLGWQLAGKALP